MPRLQTICYIQFTGDGHRSNRECTARHLINCASHQHRVPNKWTALAAESLERKEQMFPREAMCIFIAIALVASTARALIPERE